MADSDDKSEIYLPDNDGKNETNMEDQIMQITNAMESMQTRLVMSEARSVMTEAALVEARVASTMTQKTTGMAPLATLVMRMWPVRGIHVQREVFENTRDEEEARAQAKREAGGSARRAATEAARADEKDADAVMAQCRAAEAANE